METDLCKMKLRKQRQPLEISLKEIGSIGKGNINQDAFLFDSYLEIGSPLAQTECGNELVQKRPAFVLLFNNNANINYLSSQEECENHILDIQFDKREQRYFKF